MTEAAVELAALKKDGHPVGWTIDVGKWDYSVYRCTNRHDVRSFYPAHEHRPEHLYQKQ